jgi:RimJ/RimL family protein N-acetyltransferase
MSLAEFIATHVPALERDEVRHNLMLGILARAAAADLSLHTWTLGGPGVCAIKTPGRPIVLGEVDRQQCRALADMTRDLDHAGVVGPELAPQWFAERAVELGQTFVEPIPQRILVLRGRPAHPGAPGQARQVQAEDVPLLADWLLAFAREAVPYDPVSSRAELEAIAAQGRHTLWSVDGRPVSMAGVARRLRTVAAIAPVYTPPAERGRGYAGSLTAAVAERLLAEGNTAVCLYVDLRNAASTRCYAKIGFEPHCDAWVYHRLPPRDPA